MNRLSVKEFFVAEEGSVLASVLVIVTILLVSIGVILSAMLLQSRFIHKDIQHTEAVYKAEQRLSEYLYWKGKNNNTEASYSNSDWSDIIEKDHGLYTQVTANESGVEIQALIGNNADNWLNYSIILTDTTSALTLTGSPIVNGDLQLGSKEYRTDNFKGVPFTGSVTGSVTGNVVRPSETFDLETIQSILDSLSILIESDYSEIELGDHTRYFEDNTESGELESLAEGISTIFIDGNLSILEPLRLPNFTNVIVKDTLFIEANVDGDHLVFLAGSVIVVAKKAELQAQLISTGSISVSGEAYLHYPSAIVSYFNPPDFEELAPILIEGTSIVDGLVYTHHQSLSSSRNSDFKNVIESNALIRGAYFNSGISEVKGKIYGTIITQQFEFYESPTTYKNWIREGEFDLAKRPEGFIIPSLSRQQIEIGIVDWRIIE